MSARDLVGRTITAFPYRRFLEACRRPERAQARVWRECRKYALRGAFWKGVFAARGEEIPECLEDFPITTYSDYQAVIRAAADGETRSPLTGDPVLFWCASSGTSGSRKLFPLTRPHLRQAGRTAAPQFNRLLREYPGFFDGKCLSMASPYTGERSATGIPVGLLSTSLYFRAPRFLDAFLAIPGAILRSAEVFEEWASLYLMAADLSSIVGMTPLGTCRLFETIERDWERNRAILLGELPPPPGLPRLRMTIARARYLRRLLRESEPSRTRRFRSANRLWPRLRAVFGWKSSVCATQLPLLAAYFTEPTPILDGQYSATEAWFNVPLTTELGGPLHLGAHVFEFLPLDADPIAGNLLKPWELEVGREYEILVTNAMGLIRYRIFDIVACLGYRARSPIVSFRSKAKGLVGLDAATLRESEIVAAMAGSRIPADGTILCAPSPAGDRLVLFHLGETAPPISDFDARLCRISATYADARKSGAIFPPRAVPIDKESSVAAALFPRRNDAGVRAQEKAVAVAVRCPLDLGDYLRLP